MKKIFRIVTLPFVLIFDIMVVSCAPEIDDLGLESAIERDVNGNYIFNAQVSDLGLTKTFLACS